MAQGVNRITLIGNLGKDPEVRYTQSGSAVCNINLAIGERRKEGDSWKDHTEWVRVVCFGRTAENVGQYMSKGKQLYIEGRMQTRSYKDKDGNERWSTEVVANQVLFLSSTSSGDGQSSYSKPAAAKPVTSSEPVPVSAPADDGGFYDDDLPF